MAIPRIEDMKLSIAGFASTGVGGARTPLFPLKHD